MPEHETLRFEGRDVELVADAHGDADAFPVLLFHGGGQTRHAWGGTASVLGQRGWRAITVDLRGHGDSGWSPEAAYDLDDFADDVRRIAGTLDQRPAIVGASLGGLTSLNAIAEATEPIASALVLVDVAPRLQQEGTAKIGQFMMSGLDGFPSLEAVADAVAAFNPHRPRPADLSGLKKNVRLREDGRWYWHWDPNFFLGGRADEPRSFRNEERLEANAAALTLPTLVVRGGSSDVLSPEGVQALLALVPHAQVADVAGAGHMVAGDRNDAFNEAIIAFLESEVRS